MPETFAGLEYGMLILQTALIQEIQAPYWNAACLSSCHRLGSRRIYLELAFLVALSLTWKSDTPVKCNMILIKSLHFCTAKHLSTCLTSAMCLCSINISLWFPFFELRPIKLVQATTIIFFKPEQATHIDIFCISF